MRTGITLALAALLMAVVGARASESAAAVAQACDASSYQLALRSATGPPVADLTIRVTAVVPECELPETLASVQVTIFALNGSVQRTLAALRRSSPLRLAVLPSARAS